MKFDNVFWDWNGTLFNDATASWLAVNDMLKARKLPSVSFEQYKEYVDVPIIRFYEKVMDISNESIDDLSSEFHNLCYKHMSVDPLAEKAKETLEFFRDNGVKQYIFSSSHKNRILPFLERLEIDRYFDAVLGADDYNAGSKTERTRDFIIKNSISPEKTVFIGDMVHDCEVASAIGADCILIANGHQPQEKLLKTGATVFADINELLNTISNEVL